MLGLLRRATARHMIAIGGDHDAPGRGLAAREERHEVGRTKAAQHGHQRDDALLTVLVLVPVPFVKIGDTEGRMQGVEPNAAVLERCNGGVIWHSFSRKTTIDVG